MLSMFFFFRQSDADSDSHLLPIRLATINRLPRLFDLVQHRLIRHIRPGVNGRSLRLETDVEFLDAYTKNQLPLRADKRAACLPSSFFSTRSTAPEQPPQVMVTLNLYMWSDML